ncbi:monocarboxylate transporter 13-like [Patiria miniata]|uniref:Major facilitator superfamily (MFS) profile domain-containing protein n=1 Tax=Patiria miniata TaxID=46514 RepID=A0A914A935_PATMI|nr:monocarboxylate transporter 13-like [Patiria miniata]
MKLRRGWSRYRRAGQESDQDQDPPIPGVDHGWAWMVCLGAHLGHVFNLGYFSALGVFYIAWKEYFDTSATASSWLLSLPWLAAAPFSPIMGVLAPRLGIRRVSMVGGALNGLSTILGSLANELWQLYLCGILSGIAMAMIVPPGLIMLTRYFKKRYTFANGLCIVGVSVGQMVFPPLIRLLIAIYGWRGAMFVIGAIQLNSIAACALFRPLKTKSDTEPGQTTSLEMEVMYSGGVARTENQGTENKGTEIRSALKEAFAYLRNFTNVSFSLSLIVLFLYSMGWIMNLSHLPSRATEAGWSENQGAVLLTVFAAVAMSTRVLHGWLVVCGLVGMGGFRLQFGTLAGAALATFLNPVSDSYGFLVGYAVLLGASLGIASPLLVANIKKLVREAEIPLTMSWTVATLSFAHGTGSVAAGKIHDLTGNYTAAFITAGGIFVAALLVLILVVFLNKRQKDTPSVDAVPNATQLSGPRFSHAQCNAV